MVDRGADRLGVRIMDGRRIVERRGDAALHVHHVIVAELIQLVGGDADLHEGGDVIQHFTGQASGDVHLCDLFGILDTDCHGTDS